jgi:heme exporter protein A
MAPRDAFTLRWLDGEGALYISRRQPIPDARELYIRSDCRIGGQATAGEHPGSGNLGILISLQLLVESLSQNRGSRRVIDNLSFRVPAGEALLLTGANGAGKTTLIRTIAGYLKPQAGTVRLDGGDAERSLAEQCHYVGHLNGLKANLTVEENCAFWAGYLHDRPASDVAQRAREALDRLEVGSLRSIPAGYLSAGQKRRVALARLIAVDRPLWLLDEPTASLDAESASLVAGLINDHTAAGGLAVAATHLPLELERAHELRLGVHAEAA